MPFVERLQALVERVRGYPPLEVAAEVVVIWVVVYVIVRFVQGTRAAGALKGLLFLVILVAIGSRVFGGTAAFQRLSLLYDKFLALIAVALIVIFQPELRRALVRLGETPFFRGSPKEVALLADQIVEACRYFSRSKFGAIMAVERQVGLRGLVEGGTILNAELTARLLQTIFFPGSALHDLGVIIRGKYVHAAGVQFPLAEPADMPDPDLGSRHRAAVGLSKECDALVVIVSEETGAIRVAERGRLSPSLTPDELRAELRKRLGKTLTVTRKPAAVGPAPGDSGAPIAPADPNSDSLSGAGHDTLAGMTLAAEDPAQARR